MVILGPMSDLPQCHQYQIDVDKLLEDVSPVDPMMGWLRVLRLEELRRLGLPMPWERRSSQDFGTQYREALKAL